MNSSGANTCNANNEHGDIGQYCPNAIPSSVRPYCSHFVSLVDSLDKLIETVRRTDGQMDRQTEATKTTLRSKRARIKK